MSYKEELEEVKLGNVATVSTGFPFKSKYYSLENGIRVVRGENVSLGYLKWATTKYWYKHFDKKEEYILKEGDIVIGMDGSRVGKNKAQVRLSDLPLLLAQRVALVRSHKNYSQDYLAYIIKSKYFQRYVDSIKTGTSIPHISKTQIENFKFTIPKNLSSQTRIASILSAFDEKIELNRQMNATLEGMAQAMFREWCLPKDEKQLEKDWSSTILENHVEVGRGLSYKGAGLTDIEDEKGLPMHNLNSVFEGGGYKFQGIKFYNGKYRERHLIEAGDIIVTNTEQGHKYLLIGCPAIVPSYFGKKGIFSQHIYKVSPKEDSPITRPFLYYLLMQKIVREQVISCTNGTTVNMLSKDGLQMPHFFLPPKSIIQKFTSFVEPIIKQKEEIYKENQKLAKTRDLLLPKLMSGEIEV